MTLEIDIQYIRSRMVMIEAHYEAIQQNMREIYTELSKEKKPLKTGVGDKVAAEFQAKMLKKVS